MKSREIKFRVWDIVVHEFLNNSQFHHYYLTLDGKVGVSISNNNGGEVMGEICEPIIQQYIGIKDKNGKEIYEGDIITNDYVGEHVYKLAEVVWHKNSFMANCGSGIFNMAFTQKMIEGTVRIVGNIFENSELIKNH